MRIRLVEIAVGKRHRKDLGDIGGLAQSIEEQGLLQPIGITKDRRLVFGERRIAALKLLGRESIEARVVNVTSIIEGECAENEIREDFTVEERVAIGREIEELIGNRRGQRTDQLPEKFPEVPAGMETRDVAADRCGFGTGRTYEKAKAVVEAAEYNAENADLVAEMNRTGKVHGAYKKLQTRQTAGRLESKPLPDPEGRFDVIVIDPPWRYESRSGDPSHRASHRPVGRRSFPCPRSRCGKRTALPGKRRARADATARYRGWRIDPSAESGGRDPIARGERGAPIARDRCRPGAATDCR